MFFLLNLLITNNTANLIKVRTAPKIKMKRGFSIIKLKFIDAPTPKKNNPKSNPLNGAISPSNSWRNSELANT